MKAKGLVFTFLALLLMLGGTPVYADGVPPLPHAFYGSVNIGGEPAPIGTVISADGDGVETNTLQNPVTTAVAGSYGIDSKMLLVQAQAGAIITFYVNGIFTGQTIAWESGATTRVDLSITNSTPPGGGGTPPPSSEELTSSLFGTTKTFAISNDGKILETIAATSTDGLLTITIPEGIIAKNKSGNPLNSLEAVVVSPPSPPKDAHVIGLAYDFGPDGATFNPPITLTWKYDANSLPKGIAEDSLYIAYWDGTKWFALDTTINAAANVASCTVSHFTTFAVIAPPAPPSPAAFSVSNLSVNPTEVQPNEVVTITVSVSNTGGMEGSHTLVLKINGVKEAEKTIAAAPGSSETFSFTVAKEQPGNYSATVDGLGGSFIVIAPSVPPPSPPPVPSAFSLSDLSVRPAEVQPKEAVTISVFVANTGDAEGNYAIVLKIDGVKETEKSATIAAGAGETVNFAVTREEAGTYSVEVDGLNSGFTVVESSTPLLPAPPAKTPVNWPLIGGIIGAVIVVALVVLYFVRKRAVD
jgi:hypothetical protein